MAYFLWSLLTICASLLFLLHAVPEINAMANSKSTALHLSSLNGHVNCVKALLFYSDHMKVHINRNAVNKAGHIVLIMASENIYKINMLKYTHIYLSFIFLLFHLTAICEQCLFIGYS